MLLLRDVRDYIASLSVALDEKVYCGKMANNITEAIGVYNLKTNRTMYIPQGGLENKKHNIKAISILIHWNKSPSQTEAVAYNLHNLLSRCKDAVINANTTNEKKIKFIKMIQEEPISINTDENGIFEYVIECIMYY